MAAKNKNLSENPKNAIPNGRNFTFAIVISEYHSNITDKLRDACCETLINHGVAPKNIVIEYAPGAFELPVIAQQMYLAYEVNAIITLGCVIKGDTDHDVYINHTIAKALMEMSLDYEAPFIYGVLTVNTLEQAEERAGGKYGNKGTECAIAALKTAAIFEKLNDDDDEAYLN